MKKIITPEIFAEMTILCTIIADYAPPCKKTYPILIDVRNDEGHIILWRWSQTSRNNIEW